MTPLDLSKQYRTPDEPLADRSNLTRYRATLEAGSPLPEIVFYRSPSTDRWWMELKISLCLNITVN